MSQLSYSEEPINDDQQSEPERIAEREHNVKIKELLSEPTISIESIHPIWDTFERVRAVHRDMVQSQDGMWIPIVFDPAPTLNPIITSFNEEYDGQQQLALIPERGAQEFTQQSTKDVVDSILSAHDEAESERYALLHLGTFVVYCSLYALGHRHQKERNTRTTPITKLYPRNSAEAKQILRITHFGYVVTKSPKLFLLKKGVHFYSKKCVQFLAENMKEHAPFINNHINGIQMEQPEQFTPEFHELLELIAQFLMNNQLTE